MEMISSMSLYMLTGGDYDYNIKVLVTCRLYFSAVTNQRDFCNLTQINFKDPGRNETRQKAFYDSCLKNDHPNVFICPRSGNPIFQISDSTGPDVKILETKQNGNSRHYSNIEFFTKILFHYQGSPYI